MKIVSSDTSGGATATNSGVQLAVTLEEVAFVLTRRPGLLHLVCGHELPSFDVSKFLWASGEEIWGLCQIHQLLIPHTRATGFLLG